MTPLVAIKVAFVLRRINSDIQTRRWIFRNCQCLNLRPRACKDRVVPVTLVKLLRPVNYYRNFTGLLCFYFQVKNRIVTETKSAQRSTNRLIKLISKKLGWHSPDIRRVKMFRFQYGKLEQSFIQYWHLLLMAKVEQFHARKVRMMAGN